MDKRKPKNNEKEKVSIMGPGQFILHWNQKLSTCENKIEPFYLHCTTETEILFLSKEILMNHASDEFIDILKSASNAKIKWAIAHSSFKTEWSYKKEKGRCS